MHTVELLEQAVDLARKMDYLVRQEWLGGSGGGGCEFGGRKMIFIDLALGPVEQLDQVLCALRCEPAALALPMPHQLRELLAVRKSA